MGAAVSRRMVYSIRKVTGPPSAHGASDPRFLFRCFLVNKKPNLHTKSPVNVQDGCWQYALSIPLLIFIVSFSDAQHLFREMRRLVVRCTPVVSHGLPDSLPLDIHLRVFWEDIVDEIEYISNLVGGATEGITLACYTRRL